MFLPGLLPLFRPCMPGPGWPPWILLLCSQFHLKDGITTVLYISRTFPPSPLQSCILMFVLLCIVNEKYIGRFKPNLNTTLTHVLPFPSLLFCRLIDVLCKFSSSFSCLLSAETSSSCLQLRLLSAAGVIIFCSFLQLSLLTCDVWS